MAGEWLKLESSTPDKPEVFAITASMGWDDPDMTVGKLFRVWRWFDQQTVSGNAVGVTCLLLDRIAGATGFAQAMEKAGWLIVSEAGLQLPNFEKHNGSTAKNRAQTAKRVAEHRAVAGCNAETVTETGTHALAREEKRREDQKIPPDKSDDLPAVKKSTGKNAPISLKAWIESLNGEDAIPEEDPVFAYADSIQLPDDYIALAWSWFKDAMATKRQKDWRAHFRNAVKGNWPKYWWPTDDGGWRLSPAGEQAKRAAEAKAA